MSWNLASQTRLLDLCWTSSGDRQILTSGLKGDGKGARPVEIARAGSGYAYFVLDLIFHADGRVFLIEANGSNANFTAVPFGHDGPRIEHMLDVVRARDLLSEPGVVLFPHATSSPAMVELYSRALGFALRLEHSRSIRVASPADPVSEAALTIVIGSIPDIAPQISVAEGGLLYRQVPVRFMTNPNLLPELARRRIIDIQKPGYGLDTSFIHDGAALAIVERKDVQQAVVADSGCMASMRTKAAFSSLEAMRILEEFASESKASVGKIARGSKSAGVEFFPPSETRAKRQRRLERMIESAYGAYGDSCASTIYPLTFVEFIPSQPIMRAGGGHLWDMRFECLVGPFATTVNPGLVRVCEAPFDGTTLDRISVVSNLSTRHVCPSDVLSASDSATLALLGLTSKQIDQAAEACATWAHNAAEHVAALTLGRTCQPV